MFPIVTAGDGEEALQHIHRQVPQGYQGYVKDDAMIPGIKEQATMVESTAPHSAGLTTVPVP